MDAEEAKKRLRGPFVPMITPFKPNLELDLEGFRKMCISFSITVSAQVKAF